MQEAEQRMPGTVLVAFALILVMLYLAHFSLKDALVVCTNVLAMSLGGVWALLLAGLNFNISAAVGFNSILGVAVMNGLLMVSSFNDLRRSGEDVRSAIIRGTEHLVRPITMTALAAILGLLPAAVATKVGSQSQRPLAIVVVGGMLMTLTCSQKARDHRRGVGGEFFESLPTDPASVACCLIATVGECSVERVVLLRRFFLSERTHPECAPSICRRVEPVSGCSAISAASCFIPTSSPVQYLAENRILNRRAQKISVCCRPFREG